MTRKIKREGEAELHACMHMRQKKSRKGKKDKKRRRRVGMEENYSKTLDGRRAAARRIWSRRIRFLRLPPSTREDGSARRSVASRLVTGGHAAFES